MIRIGKRRDAYQFSDKVHPLEGIFSFVIGIVLIVAFLVLFYLTSKQPGSILVGALGFLIFFCSIFGLWLAGKGMKKEDIMLRYPILGMVLNGIVLLISVSLYFIGLAAGISIG